jgi:hypothetical protein
MFEVHRGRLSVLVSVAVAVSACSPADDGAGEAGATNMPPSPGAAGADGTPSAGGSAADSATDPSGTGTSATPGGAAGTGSATPTPPAAMDAEPPAEHMEMLDPSVDWEALTLVYDTMYSAYDGVHTFQVPVRVDGASVELSDWSAIPSSAVSFDADPDTGGVIVTILEDVSEVTIAARSGPIGGTAPIFVTSATPEQWAVGEGRYHNGIEYNLPDFTFMDFIGLVLDPTWEPPPTPSDLACNNCHTTGAKYFEVIHSPTQAAWFSDDDLRTILTQGTKPAGIDFRVLPPMLGSKTDMEMYSEFHTWDATADEITGLIVYLRSLTPEGQGDVKLPDGTYVPAGSAPPML